MNVSERQKMETINTPYDDTFRTLLQDCPELVVPLINELFGTNYTGREVVVSNENEILIIPGISEPPVRTLRATIPENERHIFR